MEWCQQGYCEEGPEQGSDGTGLHSPLQVHPVLHPPGSDEDPTQGEEECGNGALGIGAPLNGCLHLYHQCTVVTVVTVSRYVATCLRMILCSNVDVTILMCNNSN